MGLKDVPSSFAVGIAEATANLHFSDTYGICVYISACLYACMLVRSHSRATSGPPND